MLTPGVTAENDDQFCHYPDDLRQLAVSDVEE